MVATITPVGHGGSRRRWVGSVALHTLAAGGTAAAFGAALGFIGAVLGGPWEGGGVVLLASAAIVYAARELVGLPVPVPQRRRQVPEWWRTYFSPPVASLLYGAGLGVGFLTYLRHGTLVAVATAAAVSGDPLMGAAVMAPFGLARGTSLLIVGAGGTSEIVSQVVQRLERLAVTRGPRLLSGAALLAIAGAAAPGMRIGRLEIPLAVVLGSVFAWAAVAKILRPRDWRAALDAYRLGPGTGLAFVGVPVAEMSVPVLLLGGLAGTAAVVATVLLVAFSAAVLRARIAGSGSVPCGCFGNTARRDYRYLLARNLVLLLVAGAILAAPPWGATAPVRIPTADEMLPAVLAAAGVGAGAWIVLRSLTLLRGGYRRTG